jgi:uncharacterized protein (TIGR03437 family)
MRLFVAALLLAAPLAAPLAAQDCFVFNPSGVSISAAAFTGSIKVTPAPGIACDPSFTANSTAIWLHITSPLLAAAPATVTFTADENLGANARAGTITVALQTITVQQAGANCIFGILPKSQGFPVGGGNNTFNVQANCLWQVTNNSFAWIVIPNRPSGTVDGPVSYSVAPNPCVAGRNGTVALVTGLANPPVLSVTQDGSPANLSLSPSSVNPAAAAADARIAVTTGDGCAWSASSDVSWIQFNNGALTVAGTGNGGISYHILENKGVQRSGDIFVGPLTFSVTQQSPGVPLVLLSSVSNAASYDRVAVSPGEIVALFGANLGPSPIVTLQVADGKVTNSLAGTQVFFDGAPAPMIYSVQGQVSAVVPYAVAGQTSTKVQVMYQGQLSNAMTVPVQSATPAVFSLDSTGIGPGAILNQDNSINSTGNAAARLSIVSVYCTGGGVTSPPTADGAVVGVPPPVLAQTPTVTIGGVPAVVKYSGAAPGAVAGLTQINVEIPAAATPGRALPVVITIGNFVSTGAVTLAVK